MMNSRKLDATDHNFAKLLARKGLVPSYKMDRVLNVLEASEEPETAQSPTSASKRMSASFSREISLNNMPRTWKEADKMATLRKSQRPKSRSKSPSRMSQKTPENREPIKSSKPRKGLYASSRGPKRDNNAMLTSSVSSSSRSSKSVRSDMRGQELRDAILSMDVPYVRTLLRSSEYDAAWTDKVSQVGLLHLCAFEDFWEMTDLLISEGASVDLCTSSGETALHWAASRDAAKTAQLLLDFGVDMEKRDESGSTAVLRAVSSGCPRVLAVLLSRGGKVEAIDNDERTCLDLAESALQQEGVTVGDGTVAAAVMLKRHFADLSDIRSDFGNENALAVQRLSIAIENCTARSQRQEANEQVVEGLEGEMKDPACVETVQEGAVAAKAHALADEMSEFKSAIQDSFQHLEKAVMNEDSDDAALVHLSSCKGGKRVTFSLDGEESAGSVSASSTVAPLKRATFNSSNIGGNAKMQKVDEDQERDDDLDVIAAIEALEAEAGAAPPSAKQGSFASSMSSSPKMGSSSSSSSSSVNHVNSSTSKKKVAKVDRGTFGTSPRPVGLRSKTSTSIMGSSTKSRKGTSISPQRERVVEKYPSAVHVPFLPCGEVSRPGDVVVAVEQCYNCERHFSVWHDAKRYSSTADKCLIAVVRGLMEKCLPVRVFALKEVPSSTRLGALEITVSLRTREPVGSKREWITHTVFSKLNSKSWPSEKTVAVKSRNFLKWALGEGGLVRRDREPSSALQSLRDAVKEETLKEEGARESDNYKEPSSASESTPCSNPIGTPSKPKVTLDLETEKEFMSWLMRLSSKGVTGDVAAGRRHVSVPPTDLLGLQGAMKTPHERCMATIAKKGSFLSSFSDVALGDGGGDLSPNEYDALVLEHFFVYSAVDKIDLSELPDFIQSAGATSEEEQKNVLKSLSSAKSSLAIDTETDKQDGTDRVVGLGTPILDIVQLPSPLEVEVAEAVVASAVRASLERVTMIAEGQRNGFASAVEPGPEKKRESVQVEAPEAHEEVLRPRPLAVDTRVEGNHLGDGTWYKGIITAVHGGGEVGKPFTYDIEYDDEEVEAAVSENNVRLVKKLNIHERKLLRKRERVEEKKEKSLMGVEEQLSPAKPCPDSPSSQSDPFLELSQSHE